MVYESKKHESTVVEFIPVAIICDRCGKRTERDDVIEWQEYFKIKYQGGYGSVFGDESIIECEICQHCLQELIGSFARVVD